MKTKLILLFITFVLFTAMKTDKATYQLFNSEGKQIKYKKLLKAANEADIILFGELHNNPICHWLQLELTKDLFSSKNANIILGAEMFESDNQLIINEYLLGVIKKRNFEKEARLWPNYETNYKPLLEFAKENDLKFVATNIPRRYASIVHSKGFEALNDLEPEAKLFIAPLPIEYDPANYPDIKT
ncbi:MAG: ChaN family lipoprotein [Bacteroidales bacterium]|nr:ChaN family lipoprotein [Bacteroidales bacterium]